MVDKMIRWNDEQIMWIGVVGARHALPLHNHQFSQFSFINDKGGAT
jgi:hypothetical protein